MKYDLQNEELKISVLQKGAELCSIQAKGKEWMWQANPDIWGSYAPNLFPVIGCLKEDGFLFEGKEYPMTKHGFVRNNTDIQLIEQTSDRLSFRLTANEKTLQLYPFEFEYRIHYQLKAKSIHILQEVENLSDKQMYFHLGAHPAFACPVNEKIAYADYYLEFPEEETVNTWKLSENGLIKEEGSCVLNQSNRLQLHPEIFRNDALILKNLKSSSVSLKCEKNPEFELQLSFADFPYLGLWAKPNAPYVCIEPWIGIADSWDSNREFTQKEQIQKLNAKSIFMAKYSIEIK